MTFSFKNYRLVGMLPFCLLLTNFGEAAPITNPMNARTVAPVPSAETLIDALPAEPSWQALTEAARAAFELRAQAVLQRQRAAWNEKALASKELMLENQPTEAMLANIDLVLSARLANSLPNGFSLARDVSNAEFRRQLLRLYLLIMEERHQLIIKRPDFKGWDGLPLREVKILDLEHDRTFIRYASNIDAALRAIPAQRLTAMEASLRDKATFITRERLNAPEKTPVSLAVSWFESLRTLPPEVRPLQSDAEFLDAYIAMMFADVGSVNRGTLQAFKWHMDYHLGQTWLAHQGFPEETVARIHKIGRLHTSRTLSHPESDKRCTLYTAEERNTIWQAFTASQITNADGSQTLEDYARQFQVTVKKREDRLRRIARDTVDELFPKGSPQLTDEARTHITARINAEARPVALLETLTSAINEATHGGEAANVLQDALKSQISIGGYDEGETLRPEDEAAIVGMWRKVKEFLAREYSGYQIDIARLIPDRPVINPTGDVAFVNAGNVNIGLKDSMSKLSIYSTMLHEIKHVIDYQAQSAVEGAAWEGGALTVEEDVLPRFVAEAMGGDETNIPLALLVTEIENFRSVATTDATLQVFLRSSCAPSEPDTIEFAKNIVASYGYTDPDFLALRSKRAHNHTQYLKYEYGVLQYRDLLDYLQKGVGSDVKVDAYLLQACGMPSPTKTHTAVDALKSCVEKRVKVHTP